MRKFIVEWLDLMTYDIYRKEFTNYDDYLEFKGKELFPDELLGRIRIL